MCRLLRAMIFVSAAVGLIVLFNPTAALAHAKLMTANPAPNSIVASPTIIRLVFDEEITKQYSSFKLTDTDGDAVAIKTVPGQGDSDLQGVPAAALNPGLYTVWWTAVTSDDGHKVSGSFSFTVK
jgi:methionine-rich copper-binding protein CopC